jgi:hypothetical protein
LLLLQAAPVTAAAPPLAPAPAAAPSACASDAHRAFDFWVGDWEVFPSGKDRLVARSKIERLYDGCAIRENWMPLKGAGGGSLNSYDPQTGRWFQYWVDGQGGQVQFVGGAVAGKIVLTGFWRNANGAGKHALTRMTYTAIDKDTVRQHGEGSTDEGLTWTTSFDFLYRRARPGG